MLKAIIRSIATIALVGCALEGPFALRSGDVWIRDVTVVSMDRAEPMAGAHVVLRGDRIVWVGAAPREPAAGVDVRTMDGAGRFLTPGLIDGHVHVSAPPPGTTAALRAARPELVEAYFEQLPRSLLHHGFTTVVELGIKDRSALDRVRSAPLAPTVLDCGDPLMIANGYPMSARLPIAERLGAHRNFLYDPRQADSIPARFRALRQSPDAAVSRIRSGGGRCVKAFYEPGHPAAPFPLPTEAMIREAITAGRAGALPLLLHANSLDAHRFAANVAPAAVAHGLWSWPGLLTAAPGAPLPDSLLREVEAVLDAERAGGVAYMPTLRVISALIALDGTAFLEQEALARVVPPGLLEWYASGPGREAAAEENPGGAVTLILRSAAALGVHSLRHVSARGGRMVFGSDSPSGGGYGDPPGLNGYLELRAMEAAGLTPAQVLSAATLENARLFGIEREVGAVAVGLIADLLLLDRDPLASTEAFDTINTVIVRGRVVRRTELAVRR